MVYSKVCRVKLEVIFMRQFKSGYSGDHKSVYLVPIGDLHLGNKYYDGKYLQDALKFIKKHRNKCRILLMGDLLELATKTSVGRGVYDESFSTQKQFELAVDTFKPYADLIDIVIEGNHEERIIRDTSFEIMQEFCHRIGRIDAYAQFEGIVNVGVGNQVYSVYAWHGATGGATEGAAVNSLLKMRDRALAHIYLMGHTHKLFSIKRKVNLPDIGQPFTKELEQTFVNTGTALGEGGYGTQKGLSAMPIGFGAIEIFADIRQVVFHRISDLI